MKGLLNESVLPRGPSAVAKCCKQFANGNANDEVLCYNHTRTFSGFLDIIEEPSDFPHRVQTSIGRRSRIGGWRTNSTLS